ncbi:PREDICTED: E3 ubiquitin-protein ligase UPL5-like [Camelina sativa]|uniref:HECT-type E3 ubiquitin transferase n=1 Tax=Camelina sativa TaxID=90675 RepID=A0ABM0URV4_CAMSA|nr:PREDICTED: E3 ubiquitin-protein ligase UPL5-like [Camelina sativa]
MDPKKKEGGDLIDIASQGDMKICHSNLKELTILSHSNEIVKHDLGIILKTWPDEVCAILRRFATIEDSQWLVSIKDFTSYRFRMTFCKRMFPEVAEEDDVGKLIFTVDRCNIFADSFTQLSEATPELFHAGVSPMFRHEVAIGEGVLREWSNFLADELFDRKRQLFSTSPDDMRRYRPCPQSNQVSDDLPYFRFAGRFLGLALRHDLSIGILLDPLFFLQLSGVTLCYTDLEKTDKVMYQSFRQILDMDPTEFDQKEGLGLTFPTLFPEEGEPVRVSSTNRDKYVDFMFHQSYITLVEKQIESFEVGFSEMLSQGTRASTFFSSLTLKDVDYMLHGAEENTIDLHQWKKHTLYDGFEESEDAIKWFWMAVTDLNHEEQCKLLHFWAAIRHLPKDGFFGLTEKFRISK